MLCAVPSFCIFLEHLWKVWVENFAKLRHLATNLPSHKAWKKTTKPVSGNDLFISGFNGIVLFQRCNFATSSFCNEREIWFYGYLSHDLFLGGSHKKWGSKMSGKSAFWRVGPTPDGKSLDFSRFFSWPPLSFVLPPLRNACSRYFYFTSSLHPCSDSRSGSRALFLAE